MAALLERFPWISVAAVVGNAELQCPSRPSRPCVPRGVSYRMASIALRLELSMCCPTVLQLLLFTTAWVGVGGSVAQTQHYRVNKQEN